MRLFPSSFVIALLLAVCVATLALAQEPGGDPGQEVGEGNITVAAGDPTTLSVRLSEQVDSGEDVDVPRVVLASAESFPDALASSLLQAAGPLLLVPSEGPVPEVLLSELDRLSPPEVVLLGGTSAIGGDIEAALQQEGYAVTRIAGATRFDTAVAIARAGQLNATQALLVRAFDASGGDGTAAWADSVAAGAMSAQLNIPILLTDSQQLSGPTAAHLADSAIRTVIIVGGEGAVSAGVEQQLRDAGYIVSRVAGATRYETALAVAGLRRLEPSRAVLVDGVGPDGWQGGLAAARHAALEGAPVLPVADTVPGSIAAYLDQTAPAALTCVDVPATVCSAATGPGNGGPRPEISFHPASGSALLPGEEVVVGVDDPDRLTSGLAAVTSDCEVDAFEYLPESSAKFTLAIPGREYLPDFPPPMGPLEVQPSGATNDDLASGPNPGATAQPLDPHEETPDTEYPVPCQVTVTIEAEDGGAFTAAGAFTVLDLRPNFRTTTFAPVEDDPVTFQDRSVGAIGSYDWDFGDGDGAEGANPSHTYDSPGCYIAELTVESAEAHWFTGDRSVDSYARTMSIDPADDEAVVEVFVVDRLTREGIAGRQVTMTTEGGTVVTRTSGSDGRATFRDVPTGGPGSPHDTVTFRSVEDDESFEQVVVPGQTLCMSVLSGPKGAIDLLVQSGASGPIPGAAVQVFIDDEIIAEGATGDEGRLLLEELAAADYQLEIIADGYLDVTRTVTVTQDMTTVVTVTMPTDPAAAGP